MSPALFGIVFVVAFVAFAIVALIFVALAHSMSAAAPETRGQATDFAFAILAALAAAFIVACVVCVMWWIVSWAWGALG